MKKSNIIFVFLLFLASVAVAEEVKKADLAGSWYPGSRTGLENMVQGYLDAANPERIEGRILAIISPHAGYQFSGPAAAYGFKEAQNRDITTVVIVGFSHRQLFNGIAVYDKGVWRTPLGDAVIDEALAQAIISKNARIRFEPGLFREENSVEMQVPFVQVVLKDAKIVPVAFGTQNYEDAQILADALSSILADRKDVLIVASTDLSHYHPYNEAGSIDKHTISVIGAMNAKALYEEGRLDVCELCGLMPVVTSLLVAESLGYDKFKVLKYTNSGDTFGDKSKVVGYLSAVIYKEDKASPVASSQKAEEKKEGDMPMLNDSQRKRLLQIARESITSFVRDGKRKQFTEADPVLNEPMGTFVTLHEGGELRGCIGNMVGQGPLYQTVADMAIEAATGDPRFNSLSADEIARIDIEISVLTPMKKVSSYNEVKIPGHGVLVRKGFRSGVYLPQVATETRWNRDEFLTSLCGHKAGLPPDAWKDPATEIYTFSAEVFGEKK